MTATVCAWCKAHSNMTLASESTEGKAGSYKWVQAAFICNQCGKFSIGSTVVGSSISPPTGITNRWWEEKELHWTPESVGGRDFPDVPPHIAAAADEAFRCRSIKTLRSAILMARSVIEATCKDKGVIKGMLSAKIDEMAEKGFVRSFTQDAAHELRFLGNDMAHGDFVNDVESDDADAVLDVMAEILNEVYQGPARAGRMKAKRQANAKNAFIGTGA